MMSSIRESEVAEGDGLNSNQKKEIKRLKKNQQESRKYPSSNV